MASGSKVLIVEDEAITANCLRLDLEESGIETLAPVARGEDAIRIALAENPSLILMDIRLAGEMDGIQTAEEIRERQDIPIVFMTGFVTASVREQTSKAGPAGFIEKPVDVDRIIRLYRTIVGAGR
jgi:two-component system, response regulator PdtaR